MKITTFGFRIILYAINQSLKMIILTLKAKYLYYCI